METCADGRTLFNLVADSPGVLHQLSGAVHAARDILHQRLVITSCERMASGQWSVSGYTLPRERGDL
jgi:hypothetical protein